MRERWRRMEQFECIAEAERIDPRGIWAGDLLSKDDTYALREAGLVHYEGDYARLTPEGAVFFAVWQRVNGALPNYPIFKEGTR
jgi:hypothetical protein